MTEFRRGRVTELTEAFSDPRPMRPMRPTQRIVIGSLGETILYDATFILAGTESTGGSPQPVMMVGAAACQCGCGKPSQGFAYRLEPERAREIAAKLIAVAQEAEDHAEAQARAALLAAASKGAGK